ncbi:acyl-CoA synthetase [Paraburkholderia sp. 32]|uniref:acyl-CoA synthetase n=1 Tax=Paraburkholderia sp. 32 TaxID=2991057 RepID=UPI003D1A4F54
MVDTHVTTLENGLERRDANFVSLTPIDFIVRAAEVYAGRTAVVYGEIRRTWAETYERVRRLASALAMHGIQPGDVISVLLPNTPAMVEAHFGIPMSGAVLSTLNTRLETSAIGFMLNHSETKAIIVDSEFLHLIGDDVLETLRPLVIVVHDEFAAAKHDAPHGVDYEQFLTEGDPAFDWVRPRDEWDPIALNYTSGTTGRPKGVVYHHRGACLAALGNILEWDMPKHPVYLWTLPMFHCNGWCFPWAIAARAGVNICLRRFDVETAWRLIRDERVTHYCGAPVVHSALADAPATWREGIRHRVSTMIAGAAPPPVVLAKIHGMGFDAIHTYGLTETYGPAAVCPPQEDWKSLTEEQTADLTARQGVRYLLQSSLAVLDPETLEPVPRDGKTIGELMFRGNMCMKGYLKDPDATAQALSDGWFRTGDIGVIMDDGYIRISDRSKDIIISGGENISSIEVENVLYRHPAIAAVAVIAMPDEKWGEVPCAFVELKEGKFLTAEEIIAHCRSFLAGYKVPKAVKFDRIPRTSTGKIQKFELRTRIEPAQASNSKPD